MSALIERARGLGLMPESVHGPWQVGERPLRRLGRGGLRVIPTVYRDREQAIMLESFEQAEAVAAFLNWCGAPALPKPASAAGAVRASYGGRHLQTTARA